MKNLVYLILIALTFGCSRDSSNVLNIYSCVDAKETVEYIKQFEKDTGIKVKYVRMSTGEALTRLMAEKNSPQVSVWFGGTSPEFIQATKAGLLQPYQPQVNYQLEDNQRDKNWNWYGIYFGAIAFASNTRILAELGVEAPTSWEDLLKPEFKGKVSMAYPYTSGTAYTVISTLIQHFGEEKGWDYVQKLNQQIHHYNKSGSAAVTQVGIGEIAVGISFSHDILKKGKSAGYPVKLTFPQEGTGYEVGAMAMVKNAPQPELAKVFIDYFMTARGQERFSNYYRVPLSPGARIIAGMVTKDQVKLINFDAERAASEQASVIEKWKSSTIRQ